MGEYAEMMLDGTLCEGCGVYLDNDLEGFPQLCSDCAEERRSWGREIVSVAPGIFQDVTPIK